MVCLCLALLLFLQPTFGLAATYQTTEQELMQLEQTFAELRSINSVLMVDSTQSQRDLIRALSLLKESQDELKKLQAQLIALKAESIAARSDLSKASDSLKEANLSFETFAKKQKKIQARLKTERTIWMVLAGVAVGYAATK